MTYRDLLYKATRLCDKGEITLGEYEEMTKPLDREVEQEPTTKIEESNFSQEQYLADLQGAYDCGKSVIDKIFCIVHPLSIMSTPELEHKAIMQIAEMLEPLCLPESEDT